ncbi:MAG: DUF4293 family protein [Flavobacteriales bacterium]|nr:DUF4293 family protein [Flavobacteriales bacterium]
MIQRIQSIYIAAAIALGMCMLFLPLSIVTIEETGSVLTLSSLELVNSDGEIQNTSILLDIFWLLLIGFGILCSSSILMFKKRQRQVLTVKLGLLVCAGILFLLLQGTSDLEESLGGVLEMKLAFYFPILMMVLLMLALRAINKDDELVRSSERLR